MTTPPTKLHTCYSHNNPFWRRTAQRLRERGGQHRSPGASTDRLIMQPEDAVSMSRDTQRLHDQHYEPNPF